MLVVKAIQFASEKHKGQIRRCSGLPYITHPIVVMELVQKYKKNSKHIEELKCAALLHDTLEDTNTSYQEIERNFTPLIASLVMELTSDKVVIKEIGKNEYLKQKMIKMSKYSFTLKLLDRLSNIMDQPTEKYILHTLNLTQYIKDNRKKITKRHLKIISEINKKCTNFFSLKEK